MHTKVVHRAAKLLADRFGLLTVRFNFRGVGASAGVHDGGRGEVDDLLAAVLFARHEQPEGPLVLAGHSFGSVCALGASSLKAPDRLLLIGFPLDRLNGGSASPGGLDVAWVQGEDDEFGSGSRAREVAARLGWRLAVVPGADHLFSGRLDAFEAAADGLLRPGLGRVR
jgi:alpha/beta superfamily hydrolase